MADKRESIRLKDGQSQRVLDDVTRRRRHKKALDALEDDNFQDDPHADLKVNKKAPKFEETNEPGLTRGKKRKSKSDHFKQRFKKNLTILREEELPPEDGQISYSTAKVPPSTFPERKFCTACGFPSSYTCVKCGLRYCSGKCLRTHEETRCTKWLA